MTTRNGFHQGRSTVSQILTSHWVIEEVKEHNLPAILTFVDCMKAFDSINRYKMFNVLLAYGIPSQIIKGIKELYLDTTAQVVTEDGKTNFLPIVARFLEGDTLAPYLFIIVLDYIMRTTMTKDDNFGITLHRQRGRHCQTVFLTDADFADDTALLSDTMNEAQALKMQLKVLLDQLDWWWMQEKWNSCAMSKTARSRVSRAYRERILIVLLILSTSVHGLVQHSEILHHTRQRPGQHCINLTTSASPISQDG